MVEVRGPITFKSTGGRASMASVKSETPEERNNAKVRFHFRVLKSGTTKPKDDAKIRAGIRAKKGGLRPQLIPLSTDASKLKKPEEDTSKGNCCKEELGPPPQLRPRSLLNVSAFDTDTLRWAKHRHDLPGVRGEPANSERPRGVVIHLDAVHCGIGGMGDGPDKVFAHDWDYFVGRKGEKEWEFVLGVETM